MRFKQEVNYGTANEDSEGRTGALFPDKLSLAERSKNVGSCFVVELAISQGKAIISAVNCSLPRSEIEVFKTQSVGKAYQNVYANLNDSNNVDKIIYANKRNEYTQY